MRGAAESIRTDLRFALRLFRKSPFSTAAILLVLSFGLGLDVGVFAFSRTFFLSPVPGVRDPDRLAAVAGRASLGAGRLPISYSDYRWLAAESRTLSPMAAYRDISVSLSLSRGESASDVVG